LALLVLQPAKYWVLVVLPSSCLPDEQLHLVAGSEGDGDLKE
jgi:hypothetical protein